MPRTLAALIILCAASVASPAEEPPMKASPLERTCFQVAAPYAPQMDIKSDVAIVYGVDESLPERAAGWRGRGYLVHLMTGVAWGNYQDYLYGRFDGRRHLDDAQTNRQGDKISHGGDVYYMVPTEAYARMLSERLKRAVDAGVVAIHLEEPEFWVAAGYGESFKREWQAFYREPWQAPHSTPDAQYRASKLKYYLYRRALDTIFIAVKAHARSKHREVRCYVPTHSLLNYAGWGIVSPESSLARLDSCDGYIAQVWTGTARTPNLYRGVARERTFETAFLEYGAMRNMVQGTGKRMWFLADPVEDDPNHDWNDYRANYESTVIASLFYPDIWRYEVMPWPDRVWLGKYPRERGSKERVGIPPAYATELLTIINTLNDMRQDSVEWDCGTGGIGVCVSDTMMFQRGEPAPTDPNNFYGLALPLLKRGIPVAPVQLENITRRGYLKPYRALVLSYDFMKPPSEAVHRALVRWVKAGGVLLYVGDGSDPYRAVAEWWNTDGLNFPGPEEHLFKSLGFSAWPGEGAHRVGKGIVALLRRKPVDLARSPDGAAILRAALRRAFVAHYGAGEWREQNYLLLRRGPYVIASVLDESLPDRPLVLRGRFVDLLDPALDVIPNPSPVIPSEARNLDISNPAAPSMDSARNADHSPAPRALPVISSKRIAPGERALLYDLDRAPRTPAVVASASHVFDVRRSSGRFVFRSGGPANTACATRVLLPRRPNSVSLRLGAADLPFEQTWDPGTRTLLLTYANSPDSPRVSITY